MKEEKKDLSLTREIKYKEIQELINKEEEVKENTSLDQTDKNVVLSKEKKEDKVEEDDIYLTQSFRPMKASKKIKRGLINFSLFVSIFFLLGLIFFFFIYPILTKYFFITPKEVFTKAIDQMHSSLKIEEEKNQDYFSVTSTITLDTNIEELHSLTDYSYDSSVLYDFVNQNQFINLKMYNDENHYGFNLFTKEENLFIQQEESEVSYALDEVNTNTFLLKKIKNIFQYPKNYNRLLDKEAQYIKALMDETNMSKDKDELYAFNKKKKVDRYTYRLHEEDLKKFLENHNHYLLQDEECLEDLSLLLGLSFDEVKEMLSNQELSFKEIAFHLYFEKGNQFVGFDIEVDGFRRIYYYQYDQSFVFYANFNMDENTEDLDSTSKSQRIIEINGVLENTKKIDIQYNGELVVSFVLPPKEENRIAFDYILYGEEENSTGSFLAIKENDFIKTTISIRRKEEYINCLFESYEQKENIYPDIPSGESILWNEKLFLEEMEELNPSMYDIISISIDTILDMKKTIFQKKEKLVEEIQEEDSSSDEEIAEIVDENKVN